MDLVPLRIALLLALAFSAFAAEQPLPFSHKTHVSTGLKCQECHPNPDPGDHMTLPAESRCMACHSTIAKEKDSIKKLAQFAASKKPIPWVRIYSVPAEVFWNHRPHLQAGLSCDACHGQVAQMDTVVKQAGTTTMDGCVSCHREKDAGIGCGFCHEEH